MKARPYVVVAVSLLACAACFAQEVADGDDEDEWEEVVVRRKKKRPSADATKKAPPPAVAPATPAVVAPAVGVVVAPVAVVVPGVAVEQPQLKADDPPPPPEPPAEEANEPRRLVHYFCKAWKDKDYERLWWAMSSDYRKKVSLKKFTKLFEEDAETNGGLLDENILETAKTRNGDEGVKVELIFRFPRAKHRFVMAAARRQLGGVFRIVESNIIPLDLEDL